MEQESLLGVLPKDVLGNVLFFLDDIEDLMSAMIVNREWCTAARTRKLWHKRRITLSTHLHRLPAYAANVLVTLGGIAGFFNTIRAGLESEHVAALHTVVIADEDMCLKMQDWHLLGHLTGLEVLDINPGAGIPKRGSLQRLTPEGAEVLGSLTKLQVLDISSGCRACWEAWPYLFELTNLHTLNLAGHSVFSEVGEEWIASLTSLTRLNISHCFPTELHFFLHPHMTNLKSLAVAGHEYFGVEDVRCIAALTNLCQLDVSQCLIQSEGLGALSSLRNLTELKAAGILTFQDTSLCVVSRLSTLTNLKYLDLRENYLGHEAVRHLARMVGVRTLLLDGTEVVGFEEAQLLSNLTNLEHLGVSSSLIDLSAVRYFNQSLRNLHTLNVSSLPLTSSQFSFSGLLKLQHLDLSLIHDFGQYVGTSVLLVLTNLQSLNLGYTFISLPDIQQLSSLSTLHTLNLSRNALTAEVAHCLTGLSSLCSLDLAGNKLGDIAHPIHALTALSCLPALAALDVSGNLLGAEALPPLCMLTCLTEMDLGDNQLGVLPPGQDLSACFEALAGMQKLRKLTVRDSPGLGQVFPYLFQSLTKLSQLYVLNLKGTDLQQSYIQQLSVMTNLTVTK